MKSLTRNLPALTLLLACGHGSAEVIYSGLKDITIPTTYAGIYIDVDGGLAPSTSTFTGWDFNPYLGGVYVANNSPFQPGRTAANDMGTLRNFAVDSTIDAGLLLGTGMGGSIDHLGNTFTAGTEGYLGFKLNGANYGWMRVVFTNNTGGAVIKDWAYESSGAAIATGNILQSGSTVTLNSALGSFTLGSQIGGSNSILKTGANSTTLTGINNYSGTTTVNAGTLSITASASTGSGNVTVNNAGTKLMGAGTVGGNTTINTGAVLAPGDAGVGKESFSSDLTHNSGSIFEWELAATPAETGRGTSYDAVNVAGTLGGSGAIFRVVLDGAQNFSESFWDTNRTWTDIFKTADGGSAVNFASVFSGVQYWNTTTGNLGTPTSQGTFTISGSSLTWTAVPEPTGALAGILLAAGLLRRRR